MSLYGLRPHLVLAAAALVLTPTPILAAQQPWDQQKVTQIASELAEAVSGVRDEFRKQPPETIASMQLNSWHVYESYTGPLGAGTLTNIVGNHYDPGPESSEENGWGQWHRADHVGIGMDRTIATGTGYIGQYPPAVQKLYESLADCPDNLLLFFHHVPYTYVLRSGKTVIQHIYDSHYDGADRARDFVSQWKTLEGHMDEERYRDILTRLQYQAGEAVVWRDAICGWIYRLSGIPDGKGRIGSLPRH